MRFRSHLILPYFLYFFQNLRFTFLQYTLIVFIYESVRWFPKYLKIGLQVHAGFFLFSFGSMLILFASKEVTQM